MRLPLKTRRSLRMDITPLIDVVFNLVIFFLVASHFSTNEALAPVELPVAGSSREDEEDPRRLIVTITEDETLYIGDQPVTLDELKVRVQNDLSAQGPEFAVQVRADRRVPYRAVEPLLIACAEAGVTRFGVKTAGQ